MSDIERAARVADACAKERTVQLGYRLHRSYEGNESIRGKLIEAERIAERIRALDPDPVGERTPAELRVLHAAHAAGKVSNCPACKAGPDPVAEAERRLERLLAGDALEALAREDIACLLDGFDRCPGCFACDVRSHAQELEALRRAREANRED